MPPLKPVAWFCLRFVLIAPIVLVIWWTIAPAYVWVLGQVCAIILNTFFGATINSVESVTPEDSVLNADVSLVFWTPGGSAPIDAGPLVHNIPPYLILVLATAGLKLRRRLIVLAIGTAILVIGHAVFLTAVYAWAREAAQAPEIPTAFGLFLLTLPFLLWIVLAYWERLRGILDESTAGSENSAAAGSDSG